jgi:transposase-like protein
MHCQRKYTPEPKKQGYPDSLRKRAMEMYVDGGNLRRIARHLKVAPQTVAYWVTDVAEALPNAPMPEEVQEAEMDELFTFIGDKKQNLHSHCGRSQDSLYFGLGGGLDPHPGSHSASGGSSAKGQVVL